MLNTDIELVFDIDIDNAGQGTQCVPKMGATQQCKVAPTKKLVEDYAFVSRLVYAKYNKLFLIEAFRFKISSLLHSTFSLYS